MPGVSSCSSAMIGKHTVATSASLPDNSLCVLYTQPGCEHRRAISADRICASYCCRCGCFPRLVGGLPENMVYIFGLHTGLDAWGVPMGQIDFDSWSNLIKSPCLWQEASVRNLLMVRQDGLAVHLMAAYYCCTCLNLIYTWVVLSVIRGTLGASNFGVVSAWLHSELS